MAIILTVALTQCLVAMYLLWQNNKSTSATKYLWYFLALITLHLSIKFVLLLVLKSEELFHSYASSFSLGYGPLLYLYVEKSCNQTIAQVKPWVHFIPLFAFTILYVIVGFHIFIMNDLSWLDFYRRLVRYTSFLSLFGYCIFALYAISSKSRSSVALHWLRVPLSLILIANVYFIFAYAFLPQSYADNAKIMAIAAIVLLVIAMLKNSFPLSYLNHKTEKQQAFGSDEMGDSNPDYEAAFVDTYRKSGLTEAQAELLKNQLLQLMTTEKPFLNSGLSLSDLAKRLKTSNHNLTEVLNRHIKKGFFQFVNDYRVEEAIEKLGDPKYENLFVLANACGFNSKTTFIKYFKQQVGTTPSQYVEEMNMVHDSEAA